MTGRPRLQPSRLPLPVDFMEQDFDVDRQVVHFTKLAAERWQVVMDERNSARPGKASGDNPSGTRHFLWEEIL